MATQTRDQNDAELTEEMAELLSPQPRLCFCIPSSWRKIHRDRTDEDAATKTIWTRGVGALMKLREWSEIVAGPRWKTFIRRFNRGGKSGKFQYDPLSYAMNFDDGRDGTGADEEFGFRNFSVRYAAVPAAAAAKNEAAAAN